MSIAKDYMNASKSVGRYEGVKIPTNNYSTRKMEEAKDDIK